MPSNITVRRNFLRYNKEDYINYLEYLKHDEFYDHNFIERLQHTATSVNQRHKLDKVLEQLRLQMEKKDTAPISKTIKPPVNLQQVGRNINRRSTANGQSTGS